MRPDPRVDRACFRQAGYLVLVIVGRRMAARGHLPFDPEVPVGHVDDT
jgi:hypothetical protein